MLQDRILILDEEGNAFDAPGNLGTGKRKFVAGTFDVPLTKFGIKGARLKLTGRYEDTDVFDPVSETRSAASAASIPIGSGRPTIATTLASGPMVSTSPTADHFAIYRIDEIDSNRNEGPFATAFVEYRPMPKTTMTFDIDNLLETQATRERVFSFPNRAVPPSLLEFRERNPHRSFSLTLKQGFGG